MKTYKIAILGATGAVGQEMLNILIERNFPKDSIRLLASARSAGKEIKRNDYTFIVEETTEDSFHDLDILLCAAENNIAEKFIPIAVKQGVFVVDNSSAYRLDPNVPLVIPEVNKDAIKDHHGIVANPNCATIIALCAVNSLYQLSRIKNMCVSTYQAVSGAGVNGIKELNEQIFSLAHNKEFTPHTFQRQIAYNLIPQIGGFNEEGFSSEEVKMLNEGRKILNDPEFQAVCTCVRVPVYRSHSESIRLEFEHPVSLKDAYNALNNAEGVLLMDDTTKEIYPTPLDTTNQDLIYVGRLRKDPFNDNILHLWCCGDQIRKGAATNAIQIMEAWINQQ